MKSLLLIGNVPHETVRIDIAKGEQRAQDYLNINAKGLIPALKVGKTILTESNAIMKFLVETRYTIPRSYYPLELKDKALVD